MLEELAGRLNWERTSRGILIAIPGRRNAMVALYAPLVVIWLAFASIHYSHLLGPDRATGSEFTFQLIAIAIYAVGFCFFVCWLAWALTGDTIVTLDPDEIKIQRRVIGIDVSTLSFPTRDVSKLKYIAHTRSWGDQDVVDPRSSKIQFEAGGKVHTMAWGVTESEATAAIEQMYTISRFPG